MSPNKVKLRLENVEKYFGDLKVLDEISFEVYENEIVTLIGPSGCGKSTCLRCINTLEDINGGSIYLDNKKIDFHNTEEKRMVKQRIGIVFQKFNLFPHLSVEENITLGPIKVKKVNKEKAIENAHNILKKINLLEKAKAYPDSLSGGQAQRVAIARAMAMDPEIILFDEVTSALDPELTQEVLELMKQLSKEGLTMIIVSHEMSFVREISDKIVFLEGGKIKNIGNPNEIFNTNHTRLKQFLQHIE